MASKESYAQAIIIKSPDGKVVNKVESGDWLFNYFLLTYCGFCIS